ncbi:MAG: transposase [Clostridiales bacterium]
MEESKNRRVYDREFKKEAVRLVVENGRSISEVSEELGITE